MDKNLHHIEELFRSALENEEEMPEPKVWKAIDNILDKDNIISIKKKYEDLKKVAFLLFFLLLGLGIYEFEKKSGSSNYSSLHREKIIRKIIDANSNNETKGKVNKIAGSASSNNKKRTSINNLSVLKDASADIGQALAATVKVNDNKIRGGSKRKIFNNKLLPLKQFQSNNLSYTKQPQVDILNTENLQDANIKIDEMPLLASLSSLYAKRSNPINLSSAISITLPRSPVPIKVIVDQDKKTVVENTKAKNRKRSAFSLDLFFSPDFASYRLEDNIPGNNLDEATEIEKNERHEFSSTIGALIEYRFKKHWSIQSGLAYSNTNITLAPKTIYAQQDNSGSIKYLINTSSGYGYVLPTFSNNPSVGDSLHAFTSTHTLQYISLPVAVKYNITKGKFTFYIMAGATVNQLIKGKVETSVEDGVNDEPEVAEKLQGLKKIYFSGSTGVGTTYLLNRKIAITFAPTYRFAINSINKEASVSSYPNSIGLATGLRFNF